MANLPWLDKVRRRLAQSNLPPTYIRRFVEELSDHVQDLTEETMSMEANALSQMGNPEEIAEAAIDFYRRRSILGRHPTVAFLVFGLSPIVTFIVLFAVTVLATAAMIEVAHELGFSIDDWWNRLGTPGVTVWCYAMSWLTSVVPGIVVSILFCRLAKRLRMGRRWLFVSCVATGLMTAAPCFWPVLPDVPGHCITCFSRVCSSQP